MSYLVIARKWRPMVFDDMVGQEHVVTTLKNAIETGRIAHAYIFSGPRGIGKTTAARILAKAINCEHGGPTVTPCNQCQNCIEITASRSLDVLEIDGASNRGIDEIRNLRDNIRYLPLRGGYKIYIIDEFHMITKDAFNALLKTLEEPPEKVIFIFATTEPHKIIPTILSRCQRLDFRRIPIQKIIERLRYICAQDGIQIDDESLYMIAQKSEGGMRDALTLLDQVISFSGTAIEATATRQALGLIHTQLFFDLTRIIHEGQTEPVFAFVRHLQNEGYDIIEFLNGYLEHIRNLLVAKTCADRNLLETSESIRSLYVETAEHFSETDLIRMMNILCETIQQLRWSQKQRLLLELVLLKLTQMPDSVTVQQVLDTVNKLTAENSRHSEKKKDNSSVARTFQNEKYSLSFLPSVSEIPSSEPNNLLEAIWAQWSQFVEQVFAEKTSLGAVLHNAKPARLADKTLILQFTSSDCTEFHADMIHRESEYLRTVLKKITGFSLIIRCETISSAGAPPNLTKSAPMIQEKNQKPAVSPVHPSQVQQQRFAKVRDLEKNGLLKNLTEQWDAELIDVRE